MSKITEEERGYPAHENPHAYTFNTGEQIITPVNTSGYMHTHNFTHCEKEKQTDEKPIRWRKNSNYMMLTGEMENRDINWTSH